MKQYTTLQPTRTVMRTHAFSVSPIYQEAPIEIPGLDLWIMIEPSGDVWTWDGWMWE